MAERFGVDSAAAVTAEIWSRVAAAAGAAPAFWGRYLGTGHGAATPLTASEVAFIQARGAALLVIYNDATASGVAQGWPAGTSDGGAAVRSAQALGVRPGTALVADVEAGWRPDRDWFAAYCRAVKGAGYLPGFYGGLSRADFSTPFVAALNWEPTVSSAVLWSASWTANEGPAAARPAWAPSTPTSGSMRVLVWQYHGAAYGGMVDLDEADDRLFAPGAGLWLPDAPASAPTPAPVPTPQRSWTTMWASLWAWVSRLWRPTP